MRLKIKEGWEKETFLGGVKIQRRERYRLHFESGIRAACRILSESQCDTTRTIHMYIRRNLCRNHHCSTNSMAGYFMPYINTRNPQSDEGLTLETSASLSLHGGNFTLITFFDTKP